MGKKGDAVDGVMLLDKPEGMSSNWALQLTRRLINAQKAGHTGTLDPMATGLLPLAFGNATKYSADLLKADKRYRAVLTLGRRPTPWTRRHRHRDERQGRHARSVRGGSA